MESVPVLVCDIGGTNLRASIVEINPKTSENRIIRFDKYVTNEYSSFLQFYKKELEPTFSKETKPRIAVVGIAGAVIDNRASNMSNIKWSPVDGESLKKELGLLNFTLLNDLEAISLGISGIKKEDMSKINDAAFKPNKPMIVICPGTGYGGSFLVPDSTRKGSYDVYPSEVGHSNHGPGGTLQHEYYQYTHLKAKTENVWVEKMVCGKSVLEIFEFLKLKKRIMIAEVEKGFDLSGNDQKTLNSLGKTIFEFGIHNKEEVCTDTLNLFIEILATEAANSALRFLCFGGIYITGGIIDFISDYIIKTKDTVFLPAFHAKEPAMLKILHNVPIYLVKSNDLLGIDGCIKKTEQIIRIGMDSNKEIDIIEEEKEMGNSTV